MTRWAVPAAFDKHAQRFASELRQNLAQSQLGYERAEHALRQARKFFASQPKQHNYDFIDAAEHGQPRSSPALGQIAAPIRARRQAQALGKGKLREYYENYFPHASQDPKKA